MLRILTSLLISSVVTFANARVQMPVVGTGDGIDIMKAIGHAYSQEERTPEIIVPPSIGSGGGIGAVGNGSAIIGRVARKLKVEEIAHGLNYVPLARIPTVFFVNKGLKITHLTSRQIADIYEGKIRNWQEVGGADLKIRIVRREDGDSSLQAITASMQHWKGLVMTERTKTAVSTQEAIDTVQEIAGTIGFGPFSSKLSQNVQVLTIDGLSATDAAYPSFVELALIFKSETVTPDAKQFIAFSRMQKAKEIISSFGAIPVAR